MRITSALIWMLLLPGFLQAQIVESQYPDPSLTLRLRLANKGIAVTEDSLVANLRNPDWSIAAMAAMGFELIEKTPGAVEALKAVVADKKSHDSMVVYAVASLYRWKALVPGWEEEALARMTNPSELGDPDLLARTLAEYGGRTEGWPILAAKIARETADGRIAREWIRPFDGLKDKDGKIIDVVTELERIRTNASGAVQADIARNIAAVSAKRATKARPEATAKENR